MIRVEEPLGLASFGLVGKVGTYYDGDSYLHSSAVHLDELASALGTWHVLAWGVHDSVVGLVACVDQCVLLDLDEEADLNGPSD